MIDVMSEKERDSLSEFRRTLESAIRDFRIESLNDQQIDQLTLHYSMMRRWNQKINLTRIIDAEEAARLHYGESLFGAQFALESCNIIDLGSGAGFPAVALAVICMQSHITALEVNPKKALFLEEVKDELRLDNFSVAQRRLEDFDLSNFDLITSRAIERAEQVIPRVLESLHIGQRLMLYCASDLCDDLREQFATKLSIEVHRVPHSRARVIVIFSRS